jgi:hypothetical protein
MKALEYKEYFNYTDLWRILKSLEDIQVYFSIWNTESSAKRWVNIWLFGLCNVMRAFDLPRWKGRAYFNMYPQPS